jgi:hypothetical protein
MNSELTYEQRRSTRVDYRFFFKNYTVKIKKIVVCFKSQEIKKKKNSFKNVA